MLCFTRARPKKTSRCRRQSPYPRAGKPASGGIDVHEGYSDATVIARKIQPMAVLRKNEGKRIRSLIGRAQGKIALGKLQGVTGKGLGRSCFH